MTGRPLAGIRVLELARILAGPWAGQLLADLGAEVVKVERPGSGDDTRHWGPPFAVGADGEELGAAYFHACNRGKRSVALDLQTAAGRRAILELARSSDVLIENFKVGGLARFGLDYAAMRSVAPGLVYCSITGFGQTGPYAARAGYDFMVQGMGGIMDLTGEPDGPPQKIGVAYADIVTGVYAVVAILAALRARDTTGQGAHIDMSLLDCMVGTLANQALNHLVAGITPTRMGNTHPNIVPYQTFAVADGHVIVAVGNDAQFTRLCAVLGVPHLAHEPDFSTNPRRVTNRAQLTAALSAPISHRTRDDLLGALAAVGVPAGPINTVADVFADPQVQARGLVLAADGARRTVPGVACPIVIDGQRMVAPDGSPNLPA